MCGICGSLYRSERSHLDADVQYMCDAIAHRGPDASGLWSDPKAGVTLGHRRLAIQDLSEAGAQPMVSECGRYILTFNGEIYNHLDLREQLKAVAGAQAWRGSSDTETLLVGIAFWGLKEALCRSHGMFALSLWDRDTSTLYLARDRLGEKPLYFTKVGQRWLFASELLAFKAVASFPFRLRQSAISSYLSKGYVPDDTCIFEDVSKVPPGNIVTLRPGSDHEHVEVYQSFPQIVSRAIVDRNARTLEENELDTVETVLRKVISEQMIGDVSIGCFLSGGIDSSLVASLMQAERQVQISTFSIGFDVKTFNEAPYAAAVANILHTNHTEFILSEDEALSIVPTMASIYDEPFGDSSQIATALLCREARQHVTVALSGDGGDEVFGGYNRHIMGPSLWRALQWTPSFARRWCVSLARSKCSTQGDDHRSLRLIARKMGLHPNLIDKAIALIPILSSADSKESLYNCFTSQNHDVSAFFTNPEFFAGLAAPPAEFSDLDFAEWMMAMDSSTYLPGDILVKVDRASMAVSLETRAPFLDARVVAAAWRLHGDEKINGRLGKQPLRNLLRRYIPNNLIDRPKQGFAVPIGRWLRGPLFSWGEDLVNDRNLSGLAGLEHKAVLGLWDLHVGGSVDKSAQLWPVLMLLSWLRLNEAFLLSGIQPVDGVSRL